MRSKIVDNEITKVFLWIIGIPATFLVLSGFIFGGGILLLFFKDISGFAVGVTSLLSVLGVVGAWLRILNSNGSISERNKIIIKSLLVCGVFSAVVSAVYTYIASFPLVATIALALFSVGGVVLVLSTK